MSQTQNDAQLVPFEIWEVPLDNATIKFRKPLVLTPQILDRGTPGECLFAENTDLDLSAVGVDREELLSCLRSDIRMTWKRIAQKHDNELIPEDRELKHRLLEAAEEVNDG